MVGIAGAGDNCKIGKVGADALDRLCRQHRVVHRQDQRFRRIEMQTVQGSRLSYIAKHDIIAFAPSRHDRVDIMLDSNIGLVMRLQHFGHQLADAPETYDNGSRFGIDADLIFKRQPARPHLNSARHIMTDTCEYRCDQKANDGGDLPEFCGFGINNLGRTGGTQNNQGGFGRASHQQPSFGRYPGPDPCKFQQAANDKGVDSYRHNHGRSQLVPVGQYKADVDLHPDADQEHAKRQPLKWLDHGFDFAAIVSFRYEQTRDQGTDYGRKADCCGR